MENSCSYCKIPIKFESVDDFFKTLENTHDKQYAAVASCINNFPLDWKIQCLNENPDLLKFITDKTEELCRLTVDNYGYALEYVPEQMKTPELCRLAVENTGLALAFVPEKLKTPEMCRLAVENDGFAFQYVPKHLRDQI